MGFYKRLLVSGETFINMGNTLMFLTLIMETFSDVL